MSKPLSRPRTPTTTLPNRAGGIWISRSPTSGSARLRRSPSYRDSRDLFCLARLGIRPNPVEFVGQPLAKLRVLAPSTFSRRLRLQVGGVVPLVGERPAAVELRIHTGDALSRKYRSWVMATTVPGYFSRCCPATARSPHPGGFVGSSSSNRSGCCNSSLHSATVVAHHRRAPSHRRPVAGISARPSPARVGHRDPRPADGRAPPCKVPISANSES